MHDMVGTSATATTNTCLTWHVKNSNLVSSITLQIVDHGQSLPTPRTPRPSIVNDFKNNHPLLGFNNHVKTKVVMIAATWWSSHGDQLCGEMTMSHHCDLIRSQKTERSRDVTNACTTSEMRRTCSSRRPQALVPTSSWSRRHSDALDIVGRPTHIFKDKHPMGSPEQRWQPSIQRPCANG